MKLIRILEIPIQLIKLHLGKYLVKDLNNAIKRYEFIGALGEYIIPHDWINEYLKRKEAKIRVIKTKCGKSLYYLPNPNFPEEFW